MFRAGSKSLEGGTHREAELTRKRRLGFSATWDSVQLAAKIEGRCILPRKEDRALGNCPDFQQGIRGIQESRIVTPCSRSGSCIERPTSDGKH